MVEVTVISSTMVRPENIKQSGREKIHLTPHDLDLLYLFYPQRGLLFHKPDPENSIIPRLMASLSTALEIYFPFAGRLVKVNNHEDDTVSFYIDCDGLGAKFVHAKAESITVNDVLQSHGSVPYFISKFFPANNVQSRDALVSEPLLALQVTEMKDGVFISFGYNHMVADGTCFWKFFHTWSKICLNGSDPSIQSIVLKDWFCDGIDYPISKRKPTTKLTDLEERYLKQKSKLHWLKVGDGNNKAFHKAATVREICNTIKEIKCQDGSIVDTQEEIKKEAEQCSEADGDLLEKEITPEEIKEVLFSMPRDKSPGPDGYTVEFLRETWPIVKQDFVIAVQSFFQYGFIPKGVNTTILALIPKKKTAREMKDYRPISCCNVIYKVISKLIANRLKKLLPDFISPNQSAFVKDRLLMENVLLASEIVKDYHKDTISPRSAIKIDISKAFDSVQWPFLISTLTALNLPPRFIKWIELCITTASFSVQVNGELAGLFCSERGLRQGCSLSPYIFVICMQVLSEMLDKSAMEGKIGYHPQCQKLKLTHLCFADDLLVFTDGKKRSIEGILQIFETFAAFSGLKISLEKSTLYMAGVRDSERERILSSFPFESGTLPVRYLGLPLLTKRMTTSDYSPLIERIRERIGSWTAKHLSFAGRLQLISSVIHSLTNFWMSAFRLPSACTKEIDSLCSAFLWSGPELSSKKAKISWSEVCIPKEEGGLGLRSLKEVNKTHRRRRHRAAHLIQMEDSIEELRVKGLPGTEDIVLWRGKEIDTNDLKISSLQAVVAYLWLSIIRHIGLNREEETQCNVAADMRPRLNPLLKKECFGNVTNLATATTTVGELLDHGLGWTALQISKSVRSETNESYEVFAKNWVRNVKRPKTSFGSRLANNSLIISSSPRFEVYEHDFAWGKPIAARAGPADDASGMLVMFRGVEEGSIDVHATLNSSLWSDVLVNLLTNDMVGQ
ncbi:unnamed protein product [Arabidopsis thaliana]|uniref:Reverse transcriptase domain-containing protein n=1 Tax=Arabidopsis thaliana TaxID=3702 RepID=A0A5S9Y8X5_ARATH|nr:unnamed protein product [Arabidopsis thaliana]